MSVSRYMQRLRAAVEATQEEVAQVYQRDTTLEITRNKWAWPRSPSPRDIVDTGALRQSYLREVVNTNGSAIIRHVWKVPYANAVHDGYTLANGTTVPARPWTQEPIKQIIPKFKAILRSKLR